jgi:hypothetical protein
VKRSIQDAKIEFFIETIKDYNGFTEIGIKFEFLTTLNLKMQNDNIEVTWSSIPLGSSKRQKDKIAPRT